jgi:hypothetical protein
MRTRTTDRQAERQGSLERVICDQPWSEPVTHDRREPSTYAHPGRRTGPSFSHGRLSDTPQDPWPEPSGSSLTVSIHPHAGPQHAPRALDRPGARPTPLELGMGAHAMKLHFDAARTPVSQRGARHGPLDGFRGPPPERTRTSPRTVGADRPRPTQSASTVDVRHVTRPTGASQVGTEEPGRRLGKENRLATGGNTTGPATSPHSSPHLTAQPQPPAPPKP